MNEQQARAFLSSLMITIRNRIETSGCDPRQRLLLIGLLTAELLNWIQKLPPEIEQEVMAPIRDVLKTSS